MKLDPPDMQLSLPFAHTGSILGLYIEECLGRPVSLVLTANSTTMAFDPEALGFTAAVLQDNKPMLHSFGAWVS